VFLICDDLNLGGAERQCLLLARELANHWKPMVISFSDGPLHAGYSEAKIPVYLIPRSTRYDFFSPLIKLVKLISFHKPVILHSWGWMSTIASSLVTNKRKISHISSTVRMGTLPPNTNLLPRLACRLGSISVANSHAGLKAWNIPNKKGRVVYNGFDWNRISQFPAINPDSTKYRVIMTASMSSKKDWEAFLKAATVISKLKIYPDITFHGYGDGPSRKQVLKSFKEMLDTRKVFLPGRTLNPIQECLNANIGILLSPFGEGISNSIMEYMACGLPVICTNAGGNPELVQDGITGFLVNSHHNPQEIAEKILWLKNNPDKARIMGFRGKERIKKHFSTDKMLESYNDLYTKVLLT